MKKKKVRKMRALVIAGLSVLVLAFACLTFFIISKGNPISFPIKDNCGPFMGSVLHSLADESSCVTRCKAQCDSMEHKFDHGEFVNREPSCNTCTCYCR